MSEYSPPLDDMKFSLKEVVDVSSLASFPLFADIGLESLDDILDEAGRFFNEVISPNLVPLPPANITAFIYYFL